MEERVGKSVEELDLLVEHWHNDESIQCSLQEYLGLDEFEYTQYMLGLDERNSSTHFRVGEKRRLEKLPDNQIFVMKDGNKEDCHSTGFQVFLCGHWWNEYKDSKGGVHYGTIDNDISLNFEMNPAEEFMDKLQTGTQQQREITTIKPRNLSLNLSDADFERVSNLCGLHNITVSQLLENFIGDLVCGTYVNGSDETKLAGDWFKRCWFGLEPENTLLHFLLENDYDVEECLLTYGDYMDYIENPQKFKEDLEDLQEGEKLYCIKEWEGYLEEWKPDEKVDIEKEIDKCREWINENFKLRGIEGSSY